MQNPGHNRFQDGFQQKQLFQAFANSATDPQDELKLLMQQLFLQQQKSSNDINIKVDNMYTDLNNKYEVVSTHMKVLDTQVVQTAEAMKRQKGTLPTKGKQNPRNDFLNAITLRNEKC